MESERRRNRRDDLVTMVFTDLVNSTAIKNYLDGKDNESRNLIYLQTILIPHRQRVETNLASYRGRVIKTEGDAYFLIFANPGIAVQWAVNLLIDHQNNPIDTPLGPLQVRMGMHTGSPLHDGVDFIGQEVDYAARVSALANGNQILLSEVTEVLVRNSNLNEIKLYCHGNHTLKGIGTVPIFEVLYQNKSPQPLRDSQPLKISIWQSLKYLSSTSITVTIIIMIIRLLGGLQPLELWMFDRLIQLQPKTPSQQPILLVKITEADLKKLQQYPLSDRLLLETFKKLDQHNPIAIGLDIYRDLPVEPGHQELANYLKHNSRIVTVCEIGEPETEQPDKIGVSPPAASPPENVGFSDLVVDPDGMIRRYLFYLDPGTSNCIANTALSMELAWRYLDKKGIKLAINSENQLQLGEVIFRPLSNHTGFYHNLDDLGYQILLNLFASIPTHQVTLTEVLQDQVPPELIKDHLILIGNTAPSIKDYFSLADSFSIKQIPGVEIHSQILNYWLNVAQGKTPLLRFWTQWIDAIWIGIWSFIGALLTWLISNQLYQKIGLIFANILLLSICVWLLKIGIVAPFVPPLLALLTTLLLISYWLNRK